MAAVRAHSLQCSACGAPIGIRNVLKAKVVVCPSCGTAHARRGAAFQALVAVGRKDPPGMVCLGLRGALPDGRALEVIGRVRFADSDDESAWFWDEWLLLVEDGEYLWLQEEGGKFELMERFTPDEPFEGLEAPIREQVVLDGERYFVAERGNPAVELFEGELTWEPRMGDRVRYMDLRGGGARDVSIEWTGEEIEFFAARRLSEAETWELVGLSDLSRALESCQEDIKRIKKTWTLRALSGVWLLLFGILTAGFGSLLAKGPDLIAGSAIVNGTWGVNEYALADVELQEGHVYDVSASADGLEADANFSLVVSDPGGTHQSMLAFLGPTSGVADGHVTFAAEHSGAHDLYLSGSLPMDGGADVEVRWSLREVHPTAQAMLPLGFTMALGSVLLFGVPFLLGSDARSKRWRSLAEDKRRLRDEILQAARVQE